MVMDRIAACKVYQGANYTPGSAWQYLDSSREKELMHPQTRRELEYLLAMLRDHGEEKTFAYIRTHVLKGKPFPWEKDLMHPDTRRQLEFLLTMLRDKGEKRTFRYIKQEVLKGKPFPWEE